MTVGVPTCKRDTPIGDIARFLLEQNVEAMCVLDAEGHGIGVVGYEELVRAYGREDAQTLTAEDIMSEGVPELKRRYSADGRSADDAGQGDPNRLHDAQLRRDHLSCGLYFLQAHPAAPGRQG